MVVYGLWLMFRQRYSVMLRHYREWIYENLHLLISISVEYRFAYLLCRPVFLTQETRTFCYGSLVDACTCRYYSCRIELRGEFS